MYWILTVKRQIKTHSLIHYVLPNNHCWHVYLFIYSLSFFSKEKNLEHFPFGFLKDKKAYGFIHSNMKFVTLQSQHKILFSIICFYPFLIYHLPCLSLPLQNIWAEVSSNSWKYNPDLLRRAWVVIIMWVV